MLKNLPVSLLNASLKVLEEGSATLESDCETSTESDDVREDAISMMSIPTEDEPEEELSGEKEDVIINPEYKTFRTRLPY